MQYRWDASDVKPGTVVRSVKTNATNALAMIGYTVWPDKTFVLWSLADGMRITSAIDEEAMATYLTGEYKPYPVKFVPFNNDRFEAVSK